MIKKEIIIILSLIFLPFIICFIWFHHWLLIGAGESGLPFYDAIKQFHLSSHTWSDGPLGEFVSNNMLSLLTFGFLSLVENFLPYITVQALCYYLLLLSMGLGMFFLIKKAFSLSSFISVMCALFYLFNVISFSLIWNRLQYPYIFFYAMLPIGFLCVYKGIEKRNLLYSLFFGLVTLIYSFGLVALPTLELYWLVIGAYIIFLGIVSFFAKKSFSFALKFFLVLLTVFFVFHAWWILQFIVVFFKTSYITQTAYTQSGDASVLTSISDRLGNLSYIFRMMHKDFFTGKGGSWLSFYTNPFIVIISYAIPFLAFMPLLVKKKPSIMYFFIGFSLILIFLMKGSESPFGFITVFLFDHLRFLESFRNPFEKFGLALPFAYAPLIGFSLYYLYQKSTIRYHSLASKVGLLVTTIALFFILVLPLWNAQVFTNGILGPTDYVAVPDYYALANTWLASQGTLFRVIALPMSGEGITYTWEHIYNGVEISNNLLESPIISFATNAPFLMNIPQQLDLTFLQYPQYVTRVMSLLDAKYIMIRSDVDYKGRGMKNPQDFLNNLTSSSGKYTNLIFAKKFGQLSFYESTSVAKKIYPATTGYYAPDTIPYVDIFSQTNISNNDIIFNATTNPQTNSFLESYAKKYFYTPSDTIDSETFSNLTLNEARTNIPYTRISPDSLLFPLIRITEKLSLLGEHDAAAKLSMYIDITEKRLEDLQKGVDANNMPESEKAAEEYNLCLQDLLHYINDGNTSLFISEKVDLGRMLLLEDLVLQDLNKKSHSNIVKKNILESRKEFSHLFTQYDIVPNNTPKVLNTYWKDFKLQIPNSGEYTLSLQNDNIDAYYDLNKEYVIQINNQLMTATPTVTSDWINLGKYVFHKGENEVFIYIPQEKNLIDASETNGLLSQKKQQQQFVITHFDPYSTYKVHIEFNIKGNGCLLSQTKTDISEDQKVEQGCGNTLFGWQVRDFSLYPQPASKQGAFQLSLGNGNKKTTISYRNILVTRDFSNTILLTKDGISSRKNDLPSVTFKKINPSQYLVHITNAKNSFFLVFSDSFHPLWKATFTDGSSVPEDKHVMVNSYANAWFINKEGNFDISLEFSAEQYYVIGEKISFIGGVIIIVGILGVIYYNKYSKKRK